MDMRDADYLFGPLSKLGLATPVLDLHSKISGRHDGLEEIDPAIPAFKLSDTEVKGRVLLPFIHSQDLMDDLYGIFAHALRTRGYRPVVVSCHGSLPACTRKVDRPDTEGACVNCRYKTNAILDAYGLEQVTIEKYIPPEFHVNLPTEEAALRSFTYRGVNVARYALATTRRHLLKYHIDFSDEMDRATFVGNLQAAIRISEVTHRIIDDSNVVATVANHPAYNYGGVHLATARERRIPAISYSGGYFRKDAFIFGNQANRKGFTIFSGRDATLEHLEYPLTEEERQQVEKYMKGRRNGKTIRSLNNYIENTSGGIGVETSKTVVGMFSNLLWDGSLSDTSITFESPFEWVQRTIEYAADHHELHLILKPHPAEAHRETNEEMVDWVRSNVDVPPNVQLLSPDTEVSPYDLMDEIDVGLVFNSTVGLEMLYDGIPVVTTGDTHYRGLGFTCDPDTPGEYFDILDSIESISLSEEEQHLAERYAHFLLVERHITIEGVEDVADIRKLSHETIEASNIFDHIVDRILENDKALCRP